MLHSQAKHSLPGIQKPQLNSTRYTPFGSLPKQKQALCLRVNRVDLSCRTAALEREAIRAELPEREHVSRETLPAPAPGQLQHNATVFVEEHRIRAYEVGADQKTTISTIANLLQVLSKPSSPVCCKLSTTKCCSARDFEAKPLCSIIALQEVAGNHGVALWGRTEEGFATDPVMVAMHLIFAATRIQIEMSKYPKWWAGTASVLTNMTTVMYMQARCCRAP